MIKFGGRYKPDLVEGDHLSGIVVTNVLKLPTREFAALGRIGASSASLSYLALLRTGLAVPARSPGTAVGSYPTISPLPTVLHIAKCRRYIFCCAFHRVTPPGSYPASCSVESGLSSHRLDRSAITSSPRFLFSSFFLSALSTLRCCSVIKRAPLLRVK
jgi:hypothetical protein